MNVRLKTLALLPLFAAAGAIAQEVPAAALLGSGAGILFPRLVQFGGALADAPAKGHVLFALYQAQTGGTPLWTEGQDVAFDPQGAYTVLLGAGHPAGLPMDLFASGEARWLGVQLEGRAEERRVLLVSVPYALKAGDAETLGGKPLSSFLLLGEKTGRGSDGLHYLESAAVERPAGALPFGLSAQAGTAPTFTATGTLNQVAKFDGTGNLINSTLFDNGNLGIGTTAPARTLDIAGGGQITFFGNGGIYSRNSPGLFWYSTSDSYGIFKTAGPWSGPNYQQLAVNWRTGIVIDGGTEYKKSGTVLQPLGGNVGIGTRSPAHTLDVAGDANISGRLWVGGVALSNPAPVGSTQGLNPKQIALLRWYEASQNGAPVPVGTHPTAIVFDGEAMWISNTGEGTVTKLRASDGFVLGIYPVSGGAGALAYDGTCLWVAGAASSSVSRLRARDGVLMGTYPVSGGASGLAFDGACIWVTNGSNGTVTRLQASTGALLGTYPVGAYPGSIAFDGANIWVANGNGFIPNPNTLSKLRASDGALLGTYNAGAGRVSALAFDGGSLWLTANDGCYCGNPGVVLRVRVSDGQVVGSYSAGSGSGGIVFDGACVWVTDYASVTKLRASDGSMVGTYPVSGGPTGLAFDGASIWVTCYNSNAASKL